MYEYRYSNESRSVYSPANEVALAVCTVAAIAIPRERSSRAPSFTGYTGGGAKCAPSGHSCNPSPPATSVRRASAPPAALRATQSLLCSSLLCSDSVSQIF